MVVIEQVVASRSAYYRSTKKRYLTYRNGRGKMQD